MLKDRLKDYKVILASGSPRRKDLLASLDIDFNIEFKEIDESYPLTLSGGEIVEFLAKKKSDAYRGESGQILITADTIVWHNGMVMNKPEDETEAKRMLANLSGGKHEVYTGVAIRSDQKTVVFSDRTEVMLKKFTTEEISYYVEQYKPLDKAGSYGIQDWFGYVGIESIAGCYYNVMGLPTPKVYKALLEITK